jgi:hypothetical protein
VGHDGHGQPPADHRCKRAAHSCNTLFGVQWVTTGTVKSLLTAVANSVHNISLAFLAGISACSFDGVIAAGAEGSNCLPHLMLALARLSVVLSQFSAMVRVH